MEIDPGPNQGDVAAWGERLARHHDRLRRMVVLRIHPRLQGRVDPSDVLQDVFLEATGRREEYARQSDPMPLFLWLPFLAGQRLHLLHRRHLGTRARDAAREVSIHGAAPPPATAASLAAMLLGDGTRASEAFFRSERRLRVRQALEGLDAIDRELIALRHFEQLGNGECARVLGLSEGAASKRYFRALGRLKDALSHLPGGLSEVRP